MTKSKKTKTTAFVVHHASATQEKIKMHPLRPMTKEKITTLKPPLTPQIMMLITGIVKICERKFHQTHLRQIISLTRVGQ